MVDVDSLPALDKERLLGGCVRLALRIDAARLRAEFEALPAELGGSRGGRVGVHNQAEAVFLRGHAPAEGDKPIEDREALAHAPYARHLIHELVPAPPLRCLFAKLRPQGYVAPHVDRGAYFARTMRLHFPVITNPEAVMFCHGDVYRMLPGEVWALNNLAQHAVLNKHPSDARTHMICDFVPTPALLEMIAAGERGLGEREPDFEAAFARFARAAAPAPGR